MKGEGMGAGGKEGGRKRRGGGEKETRDEEAGAWRKAARKSRKAGYEHGGEWTRGGRMGAERG